MSVLVVQIPARARLPARAASAAAAAAGDGYAYVLSTDGLQIGAQGRASAADLPKADSVVAVLADADVSWQRINLPRAPASRLRAALGALLEDKLLDDDEAVHLALAPQALAGEPVWVAVLHKAWLRGEIETLEKAGLIVERVVPASWPGDAPQGHFFQSVPGEAGSVPMALSFADATQHLLLKVQGTLARTLLLQLSESAPRWSATPAVAAAAESWLGTSVNVLTDAERSLQATRSLWNLRQFDLVAHHRGTLALREALRRFMGADWRSVRIGLVSLAVLQIVGMNAWAWQQQRNIAELQRAQAALLRETFPKVRAVLDAPLQMQRETEVLRAGAGQAGDNDLEALLGAAATAWPAGAAVQTLRFEPGRLSLATPGWTEQQSAQFRDRLRPGGWQVQSADGLTTISRAPGGSGT